MTTAVQVSRFVGDLLTDRPFLLAVTVTEPEDVRELIRQAVSIGGEVEGRFDAAKDAALISANWPKLAVRVVIQVPNVGFDPEVALLRLGVPDGATQTH